MALKNILKRWRPSSPARNIVVRRNSGSPNSRAIVRGSPNSRRYSLNTRQAIRLVLLISQAILLYKLLEYNAEFNKTKATNLGLQIINGFDRFTKVFGKYSTRISHVFSAILQWVIYRMQRGTFEIKFKDALTTDLPVLVLGYKGAEYGLSGIPALKSQLNAYKKSTFIGRLYGRKSAQEIQRLIEYIITYYISVLIALGSQNVIQLAITEIERRGLLNANGRLRLRGRSNSRSLALSRRSPP